MTIELYLQYTSEDQVFMKRSDSVCPIAKSLDIIGDKWSLLIIRDLFAGKTLYKEFMRSPEGIATNILASRLKRLEEMKVIRTVGSGDNGKRKAYELTDAGKALYPVLDSVANWGLAHIPGTEKRIEI